MNAAPPSAPSLDELRRLAGAVCDPELPPLTLIDLGILRSVEPVEPVEPVDGGAEATGGVVVTLTPTYSGCPAVEYIEDEVRRVLEAAGCATVEVVRAFTPSWTTDWITDEGRQKMAAAGIAPPLPASADNDSGAGQGWQGSVPVALGRKPKRTVPCPRCEATTTTEISPFGSTACKAQYRCDACAEPFDYFKEI